MEKIIDGSILEVFLLVLFFIALIIQLYFYLIIYRKVVNHKNVSDNVIFTPPVSIIIAAKNEEQNLKKNLPFILKQDYPEFEVIVINDESIDGTAKLLGDYKKQYSNLNVVDIAKSKGKKHALTIGINQSSNEYLVFTDADCFPSSNNWLNLIVSGFKRGSKEIVLAYGPYKKESGFVNAFICYDTFFIAIQYLGVAILGYPFMSVGRNMAYKKSLWQGVNGYQSHMNIKSGDDDLFVIQAANKYNVGVVIDSNAKTISKTSSSMREFIAQKNRHLSTTAKYRYIDLFFSGSEMVSRGVFYFTAIILAIIYSPLIVFIAFIFRLLVQTFIIGKFSIRIKETSHFYHFVFFDIFAIVIYFYLWIAKIINRT